MTEKLFQCPFENLKQLEEENPSRVVKISSHTITFNGRLGNDVNERCEVQSVVDFVRETGGSRTSGAVCRRCGVRFMYYAEPKKFRLTLKSRE